MTGEIWKEEGVTEYLKELVARKIKGELLSYGQMARLMGIRFEELVRARYPNGFTSNMVMSKVKREELLPKDYIQSKAPRSSISRQREVQPRSVSTEISRRIASDAPSSSIMNRILKKHGFEEIPGMLRLSMGDLLQYEVDHNVLCCHYPLDELCCGVVIAKGTAKFLKSRFCPAHRILANRGFSNGSKVIPRENIAELEKFLTEWKLKSVAAPIAQSEKKEEPEPPKSTTLT